MQHSREIPPPAPIAMSPIGWRRSRAFAEQGANRFRVRAYHHAGRAARLAAIVADIFAEEGIEGLAEIPGIGPSIARSMATFFCTAGLPCSTGCAAKAIRLPSSPRSRASGKYSRRGCTTILASKRWRNWKSRRTTGAWKTIPASVRNVWPEFAIRLPSACVACAANGRVSAAPTYRLRVARCRSRISREGGGRNSNESRAPAVQSGRRAWLPISTPRGRSVITPRFFPTRRVLTNSARRTTGLSSFAITVTPRIASPSSRPSLALCSESASLPASEAEYAKYYSQTARSDLRGATSSPAEKREGHADRIDKSVSQNAGPEIPPRAPCKSLQDQAGHP